MMLKAILSFCCEADVEDICIKGLETTDSKIIIIT